MLVTSSSRRGTRPTCGPSFSMSQAIRRGRLPKNWVRATLGGVLSISQRCASHTAAGVERQGHSDRLAGVDDITDGEGLDRLPVLPHLGGGAAKASDGQTRLVYNRQIHAGLGKPRRVYLVDGHREAWGPGGRLAASCQRLQSGQEGK